MKASEGLMTGGSAIYKEVAVVGGPFNDRDVLNEMLRGDLEFFKPEQFVSLIVPSLSFLNFNCCGLSLIAFQELLFRDAIKLKHGT